MIKILRAPKTRLNVRPTNTTPSRNEIDLTFSNDNPQIVELQLYALADSVLIGLQKIFSVKLISYVKIGDVLNA